MYIIVGLGNPGSKYENTRHNMGFKAIDAMASEFGIDVNRAKFKGLIGEGDYISILHREIRKRTKSKRFRYKKNDAQMYYLLQEIGDEGNAIKRAKKLEERYNDKDYHNHNPRTKVYKLVEELNDPEKLLYS